MQFIICKVEQIYLCTIYNFMHFDSSIVTMPFIITVLLKNQIF